MYQLMYVSEADEGMDTLALVEIIKKARLRNHSSEVTGGLFYFRNRFLQVLEGNEEHVMEIYSSIEQDDRHHGINLIASHYVDTPSFPDWDMKLIGASGEDLGSNPVFLKIFDYISNLKPGEQLQDPKKAISALSLLTF